MTQEETELLEKMRSNRGIGDRVFYVFNRIDETWYNNDLRNRLENLIISQFQDTTRVYKTSGLLGFYRSQIKTTSGRDRYQCQSCGKTHLETNLTIDHIIALARGGSNDISNLQTLCLTCNQQKQHHFDPRFHRNYSL